MIKSYPLQQSPMYQYSFHVTLGKGTERLTSLLKVTQGVGGRSSTETADGTNRTWWWMDMEDEGGVSGDSQVSGCCNWGEEMPLTKPGGGADLGVGLDQKLKVKYVKAEMPMGCESGNEWMNAEWKKCMNKWVNDQPPRQGHAQHSNRQLWLVMSGEP